MRRGGFLAFLMALLLLAVLLITGAETAFYMDYDWYLKEYHKYDVQENVAISNEALLTVTKEMMAYLRGSRDTLSAVVMVDGEKQDFFNDEERVHMEDVRSVFLGCLFIRRLSLLGMAALILLGTVLKRPPLLKLPKAFLWVSGVFAAFAAAAAIYFCLDFHRAFFLFHDIVFSFDTEKTWLLDTDTSRLINILPEGFFADMGLRMLIFMGLYLLIAAAAALIARRLIGRRAEARET